ncbi:MAG: hypothetical protein JWO03_3424 [Bacteroidetes bacterium]|nr:hypothetical protein [Bacteroidota bacterium]
MESKQILYLDQLQMEVLADMIINHIEKRIALRREEWIDIQEVMQLLKVSSKSTIQTLRDTGQLTISRINSKTILYSRLSVEDYIKKNIKPQY